MHPPNYFELFGTMFQLCCWQRFLFEKVEQCESGLALLWRTGLSDQERRMRSCKLSKNKTWFDQCRAGALTRTLEKPQRNMLNKRELVKLDVEVARLKARLGQNDGLLGTLFIANPFAAWAHDFQIRNDIDPQSFRSGMLLHAPNIFSA